MTGPPGTGKTMLAQRMVGLLPALTEAEALEVTVVHSVAGLLDPDTPLITAPPFVAPHHTSSIAALIGGGSGLAKPGAVSRASSILADRPRKTRLRGHAVPDAGWRRTLEHSSQENMPIVRCTEDQV